MTVIEFAKDICPPMDAQMRKTFERALKKQKFKFQMEKKVVGAVKTATGVVGLSGMATDTVWFVA